jgi:hypothetical protein
MGFFATSADHHGITCTPPVASLHERVGSGVR